MQPVNLRPRRAANALLAAVRTRLALRGSTTSRPGHRTATPRSQADGGACASAPSMSRGVVIVTWANVAGIVAGHGQSRQSVTGALLAPTPPLLGFAVGQVEEAGQGLAIGLRRHRLELLHHGGNVIEPLYRGGGHR